MDTEDWMLDNGDGASAVAGGVGSGWDGRNLRIKLSYFNAARGALMAPGASRRAALLDRSNLLIA
jgi:hypothetical protein